jgi:hypothetical protein
MRIYGARFHESSEVLAMEAQLNEREQEKRRKQ